MLSWLSDSLLVQSYAEYVVVTCAMLIFMIGFSLGRARVKRERQIVLKAFSKMLQGADQLSHDVDNHNAELADMGKTVEYIDASTGMGQVRNTLINQIADVVASSKKIEDDLTSTRYALLRQAEALEQSRKEARTDELSRVGNRRSFDETLESWLSRFRRRGKPFALMISDVDNFKWINDTHGHLAGDRVVTGIGDILKQQVGNRHFVARYGGDEFVVLLANKSRKSTIELAKRLRSATEGHDFSAAGYGERVAITFSTGLAFVREGDTAESLLQRADAQLYEAKKSGRNSLHVEDELVRARV
jgi:diguanylate cyclase